MKYKYKSRKLFNFLKTNLIKNIKQEAKKSNITMPAIYPEQNGSSVQTSTTTIKAVSSTTNKHSLSRGHSSASTSNGCTNAKVNTVPTKITTKKKSCFPFTTSTPYKSKKITTTANIVTTNIASNASVKNASSRTNQAFSSAKINATDHKTSYPSSNTLSSDINLGAATTKAGNNLTIKRHATATISKTTSRSTGNLPSSTESPGTKIRTTSFSTKFSPYGNSTPSSVSCNSSTPAKFKPCTTKVTAKSSSSISALPISSSTIATTKSTNTKFSKTSNSPSIFENQNTTATQVLVEIGFLVEEPIQGKSEIIYRVAVLKLVSSMINSLHTHC